MFTQTSTTRSPLKWEKSVSREAGRVKGPRAWMWRKGFSEVRSPVNKECLSPHSKRGFSHLKGSFPTALGSKKKAQPFAPGSEVYPVAFAALAIRSNSGLT